MNPVEAFLELHNIFYNRHDHPAVFTCEQAAIFHELVPGIPGKNIFLIDKKSGRMFLVILPVTQKANLKFLAHHFGVAKLSFGSTNLLMEKMGLESGSVSPFGLINNIEKDIEVYIDTEIYTAELVNFHPNINTASLSLTHEMFHKYLEIIPHKIHMLSLSSN
jgi:Ala-tRNA(Pro) deacylase